MAKQAATPTTQIVMRQQVKQQQHQLMLMQMINRKLITILSVDASTNSPTMDNDVTSKPEVESANAHNW